MRCFTYILPGLSILAGKLCATDQPKHSPAEQEVINVRLARHEAALRRDLAAWSRYVADDCINSDDDGVLHTKAQMLEGLKKPAEYDHSDNLRDFLVRLYGNTAVLNLRWTDHEQFGDTDIITEQRATETYVKQNGSWLLIAAQVTNLPVNFRKPVAVDPSLYRDYVGEYEWHPGITDTFFVKDGNLWSRLGQGEDADVEEYLPAGSDSFFFKESDPATITFSRDAQGHVTGYIFHRIDGQDIHIRKLR
jgi:hypothetical protein